MVLMPPGVLATVRSSIIFSAITTLFLVLQIPQSSYFFSLLTVTGVHLLKY